MRTVWIFNPFVHIAGWQSLVIGLIIMLLTAVIGHFTNTHVDGVIGAGFGLPAPVWVHFTEVLCAWIVLSLILLVTGRILSKTAFRIVDVFGTQALARAPMLLAPLLGFPELNQRVTKYLFSKFLPTGEEVTATQFEIVVFVIIVLIMIIAVIWTITLMYNAYRLCFNLKGKKSGISFTIALICAHLIASVIFILLFRDIYLNPEGILEFLSY